MSSELFRFSVSKDLVNFREFESNSLEEFTDVILEWNWSGSTFKDSYRKLQNFLSADIIALDVDDGISLQEAIELFRNYKHVIATTKSHQILKNGVITDRFRVVLFLDKTITDVKTYEATWRSLSEKFPFIDPQAKDASRFFYPSHDVVSVQDHGSFVEVVVPTVEQARPTPKKLTTDQKGKLARATLEFLVNGAPAGSWNGSLFKAAKDWYEQGYDKDEFITRAEQIDSYLDEGSLKTIDSAFAKAPLYEPRVLGGTINSDLQTDVVTEKSFVVRASDLSSETFSYLTDKDLVKGEPTLLDGLDHLLGGGKRLGEVTALVAEGKTGKNAIYHYLMHLWLKKGIGVGYASRELDPATEVLPDLLSMSFGESARLVELSQSTRETYEGELAKWPLFFATGRGYFNIDHLTAWVRDLKQKGVSYFWFDHLHWMLEDPEEYKLASVLSRQLSDLAKNENIHIDIIIQPKVLMDGQKLSLNSMKGGSAIGQNINNLLTLERVAGQKNISKLTLKAARSRLATLGEIYLSYDPNTLRLEEVEKEEIEVSKPLYDAEDGNIIRPSWEKKML